MREPGVKCPTSHIALVLQFVLGSRLLSTDFALVDLSGVREELERGAALHLRMAARRRIAKGARLPLPRYIAL